MFKIFGLHCYYIIKQGPTNDSYILEKRNYLFSKNKNKSNFWLIYKVHF